MDKAMYRSDLKLFLFTSNGRGKLWFRNVWKENIGVPCWISLFRKFECQVFIFSFRSWDSFWSIHLKVESNGICSFPGELHQPFQWLSVSSQLHRFLQDCPLTHTAHSLLQHLRCQGNSLSSLLLYIIRTTLRIAYCHGYFIFSNIPLKRVRTKWTGLQK